MVTLREDYDVLSKRGLIPKEIPEYIKDNLNKTFELRPYQVEAISRFIFYYNDPQKIKPSQLLFHMATGSGKTLLMAANILYLYKQGYRNFLFFVNSTNIIEKTRDNFLNKQSSKYLFNDKIVIEGKEVQIKEVPNFEVIDPTGINIFFTTIQGLHSFMNSSRENTLTYEDFKDKKMIIISDEAHHINAWTKSSLSKEEYIAKNTWEYTVTGLFNANKDNIMLEYTATVDLSEPAIKEKYVNKIIYEYTLTEFRLDGYSKEVKVLQADLNDIDRALQSIIISQYRRKIAETHRQNIKPVVLMKSKTIDESKNFMRKFIEKIKNLKAEDLHKIKEKCLEDNVLKRAFKFFEREKITISNLVTELKEDFSENKCLPLDSNNIDEKKQLIVNSLEDKKNEIRVIFAVNMLNEGWDVLNLFDIVRLYNTRDAKKNRPGKTTIAEAQLIGRGARYFPFKLNEEQDKFKRKYDNDTNNDLRVIEELYYHSATNPRYIQELTIALRKTGIMPPSEPKRIEIRVKKDFNKSDFWKNGLIFLNEKKKKDISKVKGLTDIDITKIYKYSLLTGHTKTITVFEENGKRKTEEKSYKEIKIKDFGNSILRKALNKIELYKFDNLKKYFPAMKSISEFLSTTSEIKVEVISSSENLDNLMSEDKLTISSFVFDKIKSEIEKTYTEFIGTKIFKSEKLKDRLKDPAIINVLINDNLTSDQERGIPMKDARNSDLKIDLSNQSWYIYDENYGTSEEKYLIRFIKNNISTLESKYSEIYLLRNESLFQIYRFSDGRPIEPDFVLFLKDKKTQKIISYQLFIETKGDGLLIQDKWKEDFLKEIEANYKVEILSECENFRIIGMPFFNEGKKFDFIEEFSKKLNLTSTNVNP
jgi:type III restriction enzyme